MSQLHVKSDTDYREQISKKSKILNMPKMAQNGPKWPKLGPNTYYFCISGLNLAQLYVKGDTDYPENISKQSKILNMPKNAQKCPKWPKMAKIRPSHLIFLLFKTEIDLTFCAK